MSLCHSGNTTSCWRAGPRPRARQSFEHFLGTSESAICDRIAVYSYLLMVQNQRPNTRYSDSLLFQPGLDLLDRVFELVVAAHTRVAVIFPDNPQPVSPRSSWR